MIGISFKASLRSGVVEDADPYNIRCYTAVASNMYFAISRISLVNVIWWSFNASLRRRVVEDAAPYICNGFHVSSFFHLIIIALLLFPKQSLKYFLKMQFVLDIIYLIQELVHLILYITLLLLQMLGTS